MYVMSIKTSDSPTCDKLCEFGVFNLSLVVEGVSKQHDAVQLE